MLHSTMSALRSRTKMIAAVGLALVALSPAPGAGAQPAGAAKECTDHWVPVQIRPVGELATGPLDPAYEAARQAANSALTGFGTYRIYGQLCKPAGVDPSTVQVLVHGFTLDHTYWDPAYKPESYSYVDAAVKAGYATFTIDRLGVGRSDFPPAVLAGGPNQVDTVGQLVDQVRAGKVDGTVYRKAIIVGHSYGNWIAQTVAEQFKNVDGVIASGYLHNLELTNVAQFVPGSMIPVQLYPQFATAPLGYLTRRPGVAGHLFFGPSADPQVVRNADADPQPGDPLVGALFVNQAGLPHNITVPILFTVGSKDFFLCGSEPGLDCSSDRAVVDRERPYYPQSPSIEGYSQADAGHNQSQDVGATDFYRAAVEWANRHVGAGAQ
ncbi:alpha/beta hydrolase [Amycolatopsis pithecellobii]|nr:alpha/beta fold hydrolase [Amycolatopsis pithecellobii]